MPAEIKMFDSSFGDIPGLTQTPIYADDRGFFGEVWNKEKNGLMLQACQLNHSYSASNAIRGMHWQTKDKPLGKYVTCLSGVIQDVVVDLRKGSKTFKGWKSYSLPDPHFTGNKYRVALWVPAGFAHGFLVVSESAHVVYLQNGVYSPKHERNFRYDDPDIGIIWRASVNPSDPLVSDKDKSAPFFAELLPEDLF